MIPEAFDLKFLQKAATFDGGSGQWLLQVLIFLTLDERNRKKSDFNHEGHEEHEGVKKYIIISAS